MTAPYLTTSFKAVFVLVAGLLVGCMTIPDSDPNYRQSVNALVEAQTENPEAGQDAEQVTQPIDGAQAEQVVSAYRQPASDGKQINNEIKINVGN